MANLPDPSTHWCAALKAARPELTIVAEVKTHSPFTAIAFHGDRRQQVKWLDSCPWADVISIHTNPLWHGSFEWLQDARHLTKKPILAKGFHDTVFDVERAIDSGADHVLTVGWWPGDNRCWHECESFSQLASTDAPTMVWNARNPRTGEMRRLSIKDALDDLGEPNQGCRVCQASMIKSAADIDSRVQMVLIGEGLFSS